MAAHFWTLLAESRPYGMKLDGEDVSSWFDTVWPLYSQYGYSKHKKAISSWWTHARREEIERAIERRNAISDQEVVRRMEARLNPERDDAPPVVDFFLKLVSNDD